MNRRDAIKTLSTLAGSAAASRMLGGCADSFDTATAESAVGVNPPTFQRLANNTGWRTSWTKFIPGKFIPSTGAPPAAYTSLFFYEGSTGYGEIWATNGA